VAVGIDMIAPLPRGGGNDSGSQHNVSDSLAHALPGSEHDPSAIYRHFASDRHDGPQSTAAASFPTNAEMLKGIPGCAFNRTKDAAAGWDEISVSGWAWR